jgi:hypothetical protein
LRRPFFADRELQLVAVRAFEDGVEKPSQHWPDLAHEDVALLGPATPALNQSLEIALALIHLHRRRIAR